MSAKSARFSVQSSASRRIAQAAMARSTSRLRARGTVRYSSALWATQPFIEHYRRNTDSFPLLQQESQRSQRAPVTSHAIDDHRRIQQNHGIYRAPGRQPRRREIRSSRSSRSLSTDERVGGRSAYSRAAFSILSRSASLRRSLVPRYPLIASRTTSLLGLERRSAVSFSRAIVSSSRVKVTLTILQP
jgi:hypothetical protein